jgi:hypothetical protein
MDLIFSFTQEVRIGRSKMIVHSWCGEMGEESCARGAPGEEKSSFHTSAE